MKSIITGTEITFTKTGEKFNLTQTDTGFDIRQVKLSKNVPAEPYSFQELIDLFEAGDIIFQGFEEGDGLLVKSQLLNYIYNSNLKSTQQQHDVKAKRVEELTILNDQLLKSVDEYKKEAIDLLASNKRLTDENVKLVIKIDELNKALAAMSEED